MRNFILSIVLLILSVTVSAQALRYEGDNLPDAQVSLVPNGLMLVVEGGVQPLFLSPRGMDYYYMYYATPGVSLVFTIDLRSMVLTMGGRRFNYTLSKEQPDLQLVVPDVAPTVPSVPPSNSHNRYYYESEIRRVESLLREARRSLRKYERYNERNPSISGMMLVQSQLRLIHTYEDRLEWLHEQLYKLESESWGY